MRYLITYDLCSPGQNYQKLISAIGTFEDVRRLGGSCWVVKTILSASQIRNYLLQFLDRNDSLFVFPFGNFAAANCNQTLIDWLIN